MIFKDFHDSFMSICADNNNSAGELNQKAMALRNHLLPFFGAMGMETIGIPEIRAYGKQKLSEELSAKTINNHLLVLSRYLSTAREERLLVAPKFPIKSLPVEYSEARFLDRAEAARLLVAARGEPDPKWALAMTIAMHTGLRIGELLALDWADIDLFSSRIYVRHSLCRRAGIKKPKNNKSREASLTPQALEAFIKLQRVKSYGRVFDFAYETAYVAINRIAARAGIEDCGWHTLRHTFASHLVMESVPLLVVSRLLGHSSVRITERYAHLLREKQVDAMATLAAALGG